MSTGGWGTLFGLELAHVRADGRRVGGVAPELEDYSPDFFDQCDERGLTFERCSLQAGHEPPCSFDREDEDEWPPEHDPPDPL